MERMPSASEMERYKQEMMSMYRRANPNARPASQPSVAAQPASPPVQTANEMNRAAQTLTSSNSTAPSDSRNSSVVEPLIEPGAVPQAGPSEAENNSSTGTTPSETPPRSSESVSHGRDLSDAANRPRFPEDFPQEPPFPEDQGVRRPSDIPTEQGTGEPAAADEDALLGTPQMAFPGQLVTEEGSGRPKMHPMSYKDVPYVDTPLPEDYFNEYAETGYIRVRVSSSRQAMPIKNAAIIISKDYNNEKHILYRETSDESGLTPNLSLPAPDNQSSISPGGNGSPRFATYDMLVMREGYVPVIYRSIPVFSGVVTVQPVQMVPQSDNPNTQKVMEFVAPEPNNL